MRWDLKSIIIKNYQLTPFYHGKFYYIANDNKAFVIIGSSNISKTAYLNNYELDRLFEIDCNNPEEQYFITGSKNSNQNV